jgi:hypothetical protein
MTTKPTEAVNFFWHCLMAAKIIDELPETTATKSHAVHAIRMATVCAVGKEGVLYASDAARSTKEAAGKDWHKCGLVREHVVPVSLMREFVVGKLKTTRDDGAAIDISSEDTQGLTPEVIALFRQHPRAWLVAQVIREWTILAWITESEDERFDDKARHGGKSIRKRMPTEWREAQGRFARYDACGIELSLIA